MYYIIGKDGKEYGPIGIVELQQWIRECRVVDVTLVKPEGADQWMPLKDIPELAGLLGGMSLPPPPVIPAEKKTSEESELAFWGFWISMISLSCCCFWPWGPIISVILCILGLVEIQKNPNLKGKGLAITGIIVGAILILICGIGGCGGMLSTHGDFPDGFYKNFDKHIEWKIGR
ncbi:MAG: DUF4339 domain-containing protein [Verrucomicrobia bacterium]|nr:DUF4339 domain-containing protein [Verrucomicrobiota bacterium]MBR5691116.1 DUF4339 domain-containing protein [Verrucomicrobiota bacterium]MBR5737304.1 DUF4339 domain-containing protein [Verrucomicrobiota bacterium]MBR5978335.1 DUF4339 domain-containing protein [Verrucomicrobiota bacterium]